MSCEVHCHMFQVEPAYYRIYFSDISLIQLISFGFNMNMARMALEQNTNDLNAAMDFLLKLQQDGKYDEVHNSVISSKF